MPFVKCLNCGKEFYVPPRRAKKRDKFCSKECRRLYRNKCKKIEKICLNCGKKFVVEPYRANTAKFCSLKCLGQWLSKTRVGKNNPNSNAGLIVITDELKEYIDGLLLGDGSMSLSKTKSSACYEQGFAVKYEEWAQKIKNDFKMFGIDSQLSIRKRKATLRGITFESNLIHLRTKYYPEFLEFRQRWYPNGRKIVPRDLRLTPTVVLNWYLGDGSLYIYRQQVTIELATNGFSVEDVKFLQYRLKKDVGIYAKLYVKYGREPIIKIRRKNDIIKFLKYIGDPPVKCFEYKWYNIF